MLPPVQPAAQSLEALTRLQDALASKIDGLAELFENDAAKARKELLAWCVFAGFCCAGLAIIGTILTPLLRP